MTKNNQKRVKMEDFTHTMKTKKVIVYNNNVSIEKRAEVEEANYILFIGRPLVYLYTRKIDTPVKNDLDVYGVYSINPDKDGYYTHQYSMVLDKDEVEKIKEINKVLI